jgi:hypothetical protein
MEAATASRTTLCALPLALLQSVLARLPVDARARACVVCRAWNAALAERRLWARLDLSPASGVAVAVTGEVLEAAAARAGGQLEALDLFDCDNVRYRAILAVVTASGATLRELRVYDDASKSAVERRTLESEHVEALVRAAPALRAFDADVCCQSVLASLFLRDEPPFAPLRVRALTVDDEDESERLDEAAVLALTADVAGRACLAELTLCCVPLNAAASLDALVDAALARRLRSVELYDCQMSPASAPALARLLGGGLARLSLAAMQLLDAPAALLLGNALRASTTLTSFQIYFADLWLDAAAAVVLLGALTGHQSLRELDVFHNFADTPAMKTVAAATLGALVAANAPALHKLDISHCNLGDAELGPLVDALPHNTHLHTLACADNDITEALARERLLPALQANASLRKLVLVGTPVYTTYAPILHELQDMVAARAAAAPQ